MVHQHSHGTQRGPGNPVPTSHTPQKIASHLAGPALCEAAARSFLLRKDEKDTLTILRSRTWGLAVKGISITIFFRPWKVSGKWFLKRNSTYGRGKK